MTTEPEILVVDNIVGAAEVFAEVIRLECDFNAIATDTPETALQLVQSHPIRVVVLDQQMPRMNGTELYRRMLEIDPNVKAILLSGEAQAQDVGDAMRLGFGDYVHKSQIDCLAEKVYLQYAKYHLDHVRRSQQRDSRTIHSEKVSLLSAWRASVHFNILSIEVLDDNHVFPDDWKTTRKINAGENVSVEESITMDTELILAENVEAKVASELHLTTKSIAEFKAALTSHIIARYENKRTIRTHKSLKRTVVYSLPAQPTDPTVTYVLSSNHERARVYRELRCVLSRNCAICNSHYPVAFTVYQPTEKLATRQIDYLSDGTNRTVSTGIHQYA